jgi:hypothetical protein
LNKFAPPSCHNDILAASGYPYENNARLMISKTISNGLRRRGVDGIMISVVHRGSAVTRLRVESKSGGLQKVKMTVTAFEILDILICFAER